MTATTLASAVNRLGILPAKYSLRTAQGLVGQLLAARKKGEKVEQTLRGKAEVFVTAVHQLLKKPDEEILGELGEKVKQTEGEGRDFLTKLLHAEESIVKAGSESKKERLFGFQKIKNELLRLIIKPLKKDPEDKNPFRKDIDPINGVLLYGPPGNGKTEFARWLASELNAELVEINSGTVGSIYTHETEMKVNNIYERARKKSNPTVVLIDDAHGLLAKNQSHEASWHINQNASILQTISNPGNKGKVFTVCTSSDPHKIVPDLFRPGRIDKEILIPLIDNADEQFNMILHFFENVPFSINQNAKIIGEGKTILDLLKEHCKYATVADLKAIAQEAIRRASDRYEIGRYEDTPDEDQIDDYILAEAIKSTNISLSDVDAGKYQQSPRERVDLI